MGLYAKKIYVGNTEYVSTTFNRYFSDYAEIEIDTESKESLITINGKSCTIRSSDISWWLSNNFGNCFSAVNTEQDNEFIAILPEQTNFRSTALPTIPFALLIGLNTKTNSLAPILVAKFSGSTNLGVEADGLIYMYSNQKFEPQTSGNFSYTQLFQNSSLEWQTTGSELMINRLARQKDNIQYLHENLYTCSNRIMLSQGIQCTDGNDYFMSIGYGMYIKSDGQVTWL